MTTKQVEKMIEETSGGIRALQDLLQALYALKTRMNKGGNVPRGTKKSRATKVESRELTAQA